MDNTGGPSPSILIDESILAIVTLESAFLPLFEYTFQMIAHKSHAFSSEFRLSLFSSYVISKQGSQILRRKSWQTSHNAQDLSGLVSPRDFDWMTESTVLANSLLGRKFQSSRNFMKLE